MAIDKTETAWLLNGVAIVLLALIFALLNESSSVIITVYIFSFLTWVFTLLVIVHKRGGKG